LFFSFPSTFGITKETTSPHPAVIDACKDCHFIRQSHTRCLPDHTGCSDVRIPARARNSLVFVAENPVPNWWHAGSLPGTTVSSCGPLADFVGRALANSREASGDTGGAMDRTMWELVSQVKSWKT
jgi:hypothetical protein